MDLGIVVKEVVVQSEPVLDVAVQVIQTLGVVDYFAIALLVIAVDFGIEIIFEFDVVLIVPKGTPGSKD